MDTIIELVRHWATERPDRVWLRQLRENGSEDTTWAEARAEIDAVAAWLERRFGHGERIALLSSNCPHWFLADLAIVASGNSSVALFTTIPPATAEYILDFTKSRALFLGEAANWERVKAVVPAEVEVITLPGVEVDREHLRWEDIVAEHGGTSPGYLPQRHDPMALIFTSGTTGKPKGVIQTHDSNLVPIRRAVSAFGVRDCPRYFSYLPLAHIAERQIVEYSSVVTCGEVFFNESLETVSRDLPRARPHLFFGPPRIWEQFQHAVISRVGGPEAFEQAMDADAAGMGALILGGMGLDEVDYCLVAAAPTPPALIHWWEKLGLTLMEGFGQTEAMGLFANTHEHRRVGSIGRPLPGVEARLSDEQELLVRADGCTPGYYGLPEQTAELLRDGWLHTGDKARIDDDGYVFITGRVKDYFKTIQGKYVAPPPIEGQFAVNTHAAQLCLLGRGLSKTVMVVVLSESAAAEEEPAVHASFTETVRQVNERVEKHARIGAVIVTTEAWTPENGMLTPTLKLRREMIEERYGALAERLAREAAEQGTVLLHRA